MLSGSLDSWALYLSTGQMELAVCLPSERIAIAWKIVQQSCMFKTCFSVAQFAQCNLYRVSHSLPNPTFFLIILPLMTILQWLQTHTTDTHLFISHTTNVLLFKFLCNIFIGVTIINLLAPKDEYSGRTAPLTSKCFILYIYSTNIGTEYFKHCVYSPFFPLQNSVYFIILTDLVPVLFTFYIQGVLKFKKIIPAPKG